MSNENEKISCGAIVIEEFDNQKKILLIKQFENSKSWGLPKGHLESNETLNECAKREVKEETGLDIVVLDKIGEARYECEEYVKTVVVFQGKVLNKEKSKNIDLKHTNNEVVDAKWFSIKQLPKLVKYQKQIINDYLSKVDI